MKPSKTRTPLLLHGITTPQQHRISTEKECEELIETGFRRWIITNFSELKEHVLTRCIETKNLEKTLDEMLTRITSLKNINDLIELKNVATELHEANTSFNSRIDWSEERISEIEDQLNEIKREGKTREKNVKRNEKASKKYGIMWKDLIYTWLVYLNMMGRMNPSWKTCSRIFSRRISQA